MQIDISHSQGSTRIGLTGQFTFACHAVFREMVIAHIGGGEAVGVVMDLSAVEYIDSAGLGMLLLAREAAQRHGRAIALTGARDQVARILAVSKFGALFAILP